MRPLCANAFPVKKNCLFLHFLLKKPATMLSLLTPRVVVILELWWYYRGRKRKAGALASGMPEKKK